MYEFRDALAMDGGVAWRSGVGGLRLGTDLCIFITVRSWIYFLVQVFQVSNRLTMLFVNVGSCSRFDET